MVKIFMCITRKIKLLFLFVRNSKDIEEFKKTVLYYRLYMLSRRPLASNCCELPSRTNLDFAIGE